MVDENRKVPRGVKELMDMVRKLEVEEFFGICKILGIELFEEDVEGGCPSEAVEKDNFKKTPRDGGVIIGELIEKICGLGRVQRRNLKKLLKAATK